MSGGQKQRLALAGATVHKPELLFLDEPTSAVDPESRRDFWEKLFDLADAGTTILVSTHYMDEAERCHRIAILDTGRLVADGTPAELTRALAGRTVGIRASEPRKAQAALHTAHGRDQRGPDRQRAARADRGARRRDAQRVAGVLARSRHRGRGRAIDPNLEDVFVSATHREDREGAAA